MREPREVDALVDRLVREAGLPTAKGRDDLRRELLSHFADAGESPEALAAAVSRFGNTTVVSEGFRRAYRRGRAVVYVAKIIASIVASTLVALMVQIVFNLRDIVAAEAIRLAPRHVLGAGYSIAVVLAAVAAWELGIEPLCARLERRPIRMVTAFVALFGGAYATHSILSAYVDPAHAALASAMTIMVWMTTIAILSRFDLVFLRFFGKDP
jgi:hypothetical protein